VVFEAKAAERRHIPRTNNRVAAAAAPFGSEVLSGTAEQAAEKVEKADSSRAKARSE